MDVALIVLNYNDWETTTVFLENTKKIRSIDKIIVVDNCSSDESYEKLSQYQDEQVDVIKTGANKGYSSGNNFGMRYANEKYNPKYLIISNPDVILNEEAISGIKNFLEENSENTGMVSCKMICDSEIRTKDAWKLPTYSDCIFDNLILLRRILKLKNIRYPDAHFESVCSEVDVIPGSFFMIAQSVMDEVDMFDEDTFLYGEENIIAYKLKDKGYKNYVLNDFEYIHNHSVSISKNVKSLGKKLDMAYDGRCVYLEKYLKVNKVKKNINAITYRIGKFNYLVYRKIMK